MPKMSPAAAAAYKARVEEARARQMQISKDVNNAKLALQQAGYTPEQIAAMQKTGGSTPRGNIIQNAVTNTTWKPGVVVSTGKNPMLTYAAIAVVGFGIFYMVGKKRKAKKSKAA
jgi:hypothetical protein